MLAYILDTSSGTGLLKDILEFDAFQFNTDIDYDDKSQITVVSEYAPNVANGDMAVCREGTEQLFFGIVDDWSTSSDSSSYVLTLRQPQALFDREIYAASTVVGNGETFIKGILDDNFLDSGDALTDYAYITASANSTTAISAALPTIVELDNGIFNCKTFLGNMLEDYGIRTSFTPSDAGIALSIKKDTDGAVQIDTQHTDIADYTETQEVNVLSKLIVHYHLTDNDSSGTLTYYLKTDRTITNDPDDPDRAKGTIKNVFIEDETLTAVEEAAINEFRSNTYQHKIEFNLKKDSLIYPSSDFYIGRTVRVKTADGIKQSIITAVSESSDSAFLHIVMGKLKTTLIEKLRGGV